MDYLLTAVVYLLTGFCAGVCAVALIVFSQEGE